MTVINEGSPACLVGGSSTSACSLSYYLTPFCLSSKQLFTIKEQELLILEPKKFQKSAIKRFFSKNLLRIFSTDVLLKVLNFRLNGPNPPNLPLLPFTSERYKTPWKTEMKLKKQINYYKKNQDWLAREHHGEYALIYDEKLVGFFDSDIEAYSAAKKKYAPGTFLIRKCLKPSEESALTFHSRVAF